MPSKGVLESGRGPSYIRVTTPANLELALEGLVRKVLRDQPKQEDIYSFAADYFENLLEIRDKAENPNLGVHEICPNKSEAEANELIKLASSFAKPSFLAGSLLSENCSVVDIDQIRGNNDAENSPEVESQATQELAEIDETLTGKETAEENEIVPLSANLEETEPVKSLDTFGDADGQITAVEEQVTEQLQENLESAEIPAENVEETLAGKSEESLPSDGEQAETDSAEKETGNADLGEQQSENSASEDKGLESLESKDETAEIVESEEKSSENLGSEEKSAETLGFDEKTAENLGSDEKSAENLVSADKVAETLQSEDKTSGNLGFEEKSAENLESADKSAENVESEVKIAETSEFEGKSAETLQTEEKTAGNFESEAKTAEILLTEEKPAEKLESEEKPAEILLSEEKSAEKLESDEQQEPEKGPADEPNETPSNDALEKTAEDEQVAEKAEESLEAANDDEKQEIDREIQVAVENAVPAEKSEPAEAVADKNEIIEEPTEESSPEDEPQIDGQLENPENSESVTDDEKKAIQNSESATDEDDKHTEESDKIETEEKAVSEERQLAENIAPVEIEIRSGTEDVTADLAVKELDSQENETEPEEGKKTEEEEVTVTEETIETIEPEADNSDIPENVPTSPEEMLGEVASNQGEIRTESDPEKAEEEAISATDFGNASKEIVDVKENPPVNAEISDRLVVEPEATAAVPVAVLSDEAPSQDQQEEEEVTKESEERDIIKEFIEREQEFSTLGNSTRSLETVEVHLEDPKSLETSGIADENSIFGEEIRADLEDGVAAVEDKSEVNLGTAQLTEDIPAEEKRERHDTSEEIAPTEEVVEQASAFVDNVLQEAVDRQDEAKPTSDDSGSSKESESLEEENPFISAEVKTLVQSQAPTETDSQEDEADVIVPLNAEIGVIEEVNEGAWDAQLAFARAALIIQKNFRRYLQRKNQNDSLGSLTRSQDVGKGSTSSDSSLSSSATKIPSRTIESSRSDATNSFSESMKATKVKAKSMSNVPDSEVWSALEQELEESGTIQQNSNRQKLRREDAVQITTTASEDSGTASPKKERLLGTGELHDLILPEQELSP